MRFGCMSMERLGAKYAEVGCKSMEWLGAKYAVVGCKSMDTFGCMSMPFGCMSMARLGACLTVGSFPHPQAGPPWAPGALDHGPYGPQGPWALC